MAILPEHARQWASRLAPDELVRQIYDRLIAPTAVPVGHGKVEEFPEDVVIALLQDEAVKEEQHRAVARGWTQARYAVQVVLEPPELEPDCEKRQSLQEPFTRVFRVAELTGHPLLRSGVRSALPLVVATPSYATARQVQQVVAAAIAYPDEVDRETWARALHTKSEIAAFAFRMLLVLDRRAESRIAQHFACVLEKQFVDGWNLDAWFLGEYLRTAGMTEAIRHGMERFLKDHPSKRDEILSNPRSNPCWPEDVVNEIAQARTGQLAHEWEYNEPMIPARKVCHFRNFGLNTMRPESFDVTEPPHSDESISIMHLLAESALQETDFPLVALRPEDIICDYGRVLSVESPESGLGLSFVGPACTVHYNIDRPPRRGNAPIGEDDIISRVY